MKTLLDEVNADWREILPMWAIDILDSDPAWFGNWRKMFWKADLVDDPRGFIVTLFNKDALYPLSDFILLRADADTIYWLRRQKNR